MEYSVLGSDLWLVEIFVEYLGGVRDDDEFGCCVNNLEAAVVLERRADGETIAAAEFPKSVGAWFGMDYYWAAEGS